MTESVKADLQGRKIDIAVIPGSLTTVLQPLDKCLNKPFKGNMQQKYLNWMMTGPFEFTPARKKKAPLRNLGLLWVKQLWEEMVRSFKTCGISNALDRTEDDAIYDDEMPEVADDDTDDDGSEEDDDN